MSRSRKKTPCVKDNTTWGKLQSSRRLRRCHKVQLRIALVSNSFENIILKHSNELISQYDVCDWRHMIGAHMSYFQGQEYKILMK